MVPDAPADWPHTVTGHPMKSMAEMSAAEWERAFPDEESAIQWLVKSRWPEETRCPRCGSDLVFPASLHEYRWRCFGCVPDLGHAFDYLSGTIFQDSPVPLRAWLWALHRELTGRSESLDAGEMAMRRHLREAMRDQAFRRMAEEPGPVPPRNLEARDALGPSDREQEPCPDPAGSYLLQR